VFCARFMMSVCECLCMSVGRLVAVGVLVG